MFENWVSLEKINIVDETILRLVCDTRDFHCIASKECNKKIIFGFNNSYKKNNTVLKIQRDKPEYSLEEIMNELKRIRELTGGIGTTWRYLSTKSMGWGLKYLRFYYNELTGKFVAFNDGNNRQINLSEINENTIKKEFLNPIDTDY